MMLQVHEQHLNVIHINLITNKLLRKWSWESSLALERKQIVPHFPSGREIPGWTTGVRFSAGAENFLFTTVSRPALGPTSLLSNGYRGVFRRGIKRLRC